MHILIIEDDYLQADLIEEALRQEPVISLATIERISTESQFHAEFERIAKNPPDVIIMDVMLRWADPSPNMEQPSAEIIKEGIGRAGLRNEKLLNQDPRTRGIPVIIYTILEDIDLEMTGRPRVNYLAKDSRLEPLVQMTLTLGNRSHPVQSS